MQKFSAVPDQDFVVAILQDKTCAPDGGLWIPSFGVEILSASHNLLTKTSDGARMATATYAGPTESAHIPKVLLVQARIMLFCSGIWMNMNGS